MSEDSLDLVLDRLMRGEAGAAEEVFQAFEPVLRAMVRRRLTPPLRVKFDSMDVVQSVWADVLDEIREAGRRFRDREHLRAYLARVTYHHFVNQCRQHRHALERERPFAGEESSKFPASGEPRPSEFAQADELWSTLKELCPPAHRDLLQLKRQGLPLAEIASWTGLHESSVRRVLYDLARRLAHARGGDRPSPLTVDGGAG